MCSTRGGGGGRLVGSNLRPRDLPRATIRLESSSMPRRLFRQVSFSLVRVIAQSLGMPCLETVP